MTNPDAYQFHRLPNTPMHQFMGHHIISDQITREGLAFVWHELEKILQARVEGDVVEFGCYAGTTSLFIRRLLDQYERKVSAQETGALSVSPERFTGLPAGAPVALAHSYDTESAPVHPNRSFHVYDSFAGLPEKSSKDQNAAGVDFEAGKLSVSKKDFLREFHAAGLRPPIVHKAWFDDLTDKDLPEKIAFAFLDGDFYDSILASLKLVWPRMTKGGVVLVDDYQRETLPGVERAIRDFFRHSQRPLTAQAGIARLT